MAVGPDVTYTTTVAHAGDHGERNVITWTRRDRHTGERQQVRITLVISGIEIEHVMSDDLSLPSIGTRVVRITKAYVEDVAIVDPVRTGPRRWPWVRSDSPPAGS